MAVGHMRLRHHSASARQFHGTGWEPHLHSAASEGGPGGGAPSGEGEKPCDLGMLRVAPKTTKQGTRSINLPIILNY